MRLQDGLEFSLELRRCRVLLPCGSAGAVFLQAGAFNPSVGCCGLRLCTRVRRIGWGSCRRVICVPWWMGSSWPHRHGRGYQVMVSEVARLQWRVDKL